MADLFDRLLGGNAPASAKQIVVSSSTSAAAWASGSSAHESWTDVGSFSNSWANLGGSYSNAGYMISPVGIVSLRGAIQSGKPGSTAFTLPSGYRPPATMIFNVATSGWTQNYDVNLASLATQTFTTDGNYTIDGNTWTKFNSSAEVTHANLDGTTGLVFTPTSGSDYNGTTRTLPGLYSNLSNFIPGYSVDWGVRIWVNVASSNEAANFDSAVCGVDTGSAVFGFVLKRGRTSTGSAGGSAFINISQSNAGFQNDVYTLSSSNNVMMIEVKPDLYPRFMAYSGAYSSGWPAYNSLTRLHGYSANGGFDFGQLTTTPLKVFLAAQRAGSTTSYVCKLGRLKIESLPPYGTQFGQIQIDSSGNVTPLTPCGNSQVQLDGINFAAA